MRKLILFITYIPLIQMAYVVVTVIASVIFKERVVLNAVMGHSMIMTVPLLFISLYSKKSTSVIYFCWWHTIVLFGLLGNEIITLLYAMFQPKISLQFTHILMGVTALTILLAAGFAIIGQKRQGVLKNNTTK